MIIIGLKSAGIGNCMFQYAAARALAVKNNTIVKIDISELNISNQLGSHVDSTEKQFQLFNNSIGVFNIEYEFADNKEVKKFRGWGNGKLLTNKIKRKLRRLLNHYPKSYFKEKTIHKYQPELLSYNGDTYLDGTLINPNYFKGVEQILRRELVFRTEPIGKNLDISEQISSCESVSIHVRRGDYCNTSQTANIYPVYGLEYYKKAIDIINKKIISPKFFIFSDDIEWVKEEFGFISNSCIVDHNSIENGAEDMRLMSQCKHNIITNSTFSWWGAWLNTNPDKIIIAPKKWRNDSIDTSDLSMNQWYNI